MKIRDILFVFCLFCSGLCAAQSKLHFIVFADTHDRSLGETNLKTFNNLSSSTGLVNTIAQYAGLQPNLLLYEGDKCNPKELDILLTTLKVAPDDVIFFYFIGHGWNNRQNDYPSFIFGNAYTDRATIETISRNQYDIYRSLIAKQARLSIVIGEACNKERSDAPPVISKREIEIMSPKPYDPQKIKSLFRDWTGSFILSSCQRNQFSYSDLKGGWMSVAWQNTFNDMCTDTYKNKVDWKLFLTSIQQKTVVTAKKNQQQQQPQFEMNIVPFNAKSTIPPVLTTTKPIITSNQPCPSIDSYVNETALAGIKEDLPLLHEMYDEIDSDNAKEYADAFGLFFQNQQNFYSKLGTMVFYEATTLPDKCRPTFENNTKWVFASTYEIHQRLAVINKYTQTPNRLVLQARSDLPSIISRLEEILEKFDK